MTTRRSPSGALRGTRARGGGEPEPEAAEKAETEASEPEKRGGGADGCSPADGGGTRGLGARVQIPRRSESGRRRRARLLRARQAPAPGGRRRRPRRVELEASVKIVDPTGVGALDLDAFIAVGAAVRALKLGGRAPSAKPVPVQREYVFDDSHPFAAKFRAIADVNGEIDGDSYRALLDRAGLTRDDGDSGGVGGESAEAPGRIGGSQAEVVERIMATGCNGFVFAQGWPRRGTRDTTAGAVQMIFLLALRRYDRVAERGERRRPWADMSFAEVVETTVLADLDPCT